MTETSDILVIGAGIAGVGAGAMAAAAGARVCVLEAEATPAYHTTGRSAAIYIRNYGGPVLRAVNDAAHPAFMDPEGFSGGAIEGALLSRRGVLTIATDDELEGLEASFAESKGLERLTGPEAEALFPLLKKGRVAAASLEPDASDIDVDRLFQGFARMLRRAGGRIVTGARVGKIERVGDVWRVETPAGVFEAPALVNAAGAWADEVAEMAGAKRLGIVPKRRSAAILPLPAGVDSSAWPLIDPVAFDWYAKPQSGSLMVSPADEDPVAPMDAWPDDMVLAEGLDRFAQAMDYEVTRVERAWAGLRSFAPDETPVVGFAPETEGFFWLAGQGGHGIQTSPALSALAGALLTGGAPAMDAGTVAALSPARFA
ncbi:FAD-dependent oxidoreductase [Albimonas sp. CAU 1670]|uniref:NAD(P)/FAD-dependent oxidoreductase n=1 Tax=Albimonas sp. CAU 1670 TaxID=3032599 RepID=UPI0023DA77B9|nr:FAD-dependent oxidoreductase [Albimonas sp. CAU 1670]MDF2233935.1 FAD-dependent oxidoreductase [Albimonas sp. CAU 1670]